MFDPKLYSPQNIGNKINFHQLKQETNPIAFFVNGFGGCAPCITRNLHKNLQLQNISVCDLDWNDIYLRKRSVYLQFTDRIFINDMVNKVIPTINSQRKIIAIGHSLGANALLEIARIIMPRKIAFLGILDAVKNWGLRSTKPIASNVEYFYNRWTKNSSLPHNLSPISIPGINHQIGVAINANRSGELSISNYATHNNQKEQSYSYYADGSPIVVANQTECYCSNNNQHQILTHGCQNAIYKDLYIQQQIFNIIQKII